MDFIVENIRLKELVAIVQSNRPFFDELNQFLKLNGYKHLRAFVSESDDKKAELILLSYLKSQSTAVLYDGVCRPYDDAKAKWYFLAWIFRDAPAQRLGPMVSQATGTNTTEKQANLLNSIRMHVRALFPNEEQWEWPALSEILLSRLEGSRRALRGNLFEAIVRRSLEQLFLLNGLRLTIGDKEVRINEETYDVQVYGNNGQVILIPVKTRETMGGGHALLFTRDIHKSISVAHAAGRICLPVIIAESWSGKLGSLDCDHFIYIQANPNQVPIIEPLLLKEFEKVLGVFQSIS
jgi:hypothetical protein